MNHISSNFYPYRQHELVQISSESLTYVKTLIDNLFHQVLALLADLESRLKIQDKVIQDQAKVIAEMTDELQNQTRVNAKLSDQLQNKTDEVSYKIQGLNQCYDEIANTTSRLKELDGLLNTLQPLACQQLAPTSGHRQAECDFESPGGPWIIFQVLFRFKFCLGSSL